MRRVIAATVVLMLFLEPVVLAVGKNKAMYVGGTITTVPAKTEGTLVTSNEERFIFVGEKDSGMIEIPYKDVTELEYGQKAGRAVRDYLLIGIGALLFKHRKHYLTLTFKDKDGKDQAVVLELGKELIRTTLTIVETRTGRKVIYQDEEAAKSRAN